MNEQMCCVTIASVHTEQLRFFSPSLGGKFPVDGGTAIAATVDAVDAAAAVDAVDAAAAAALGANVCSCACWQHTMDVIALGTNFSNNQHVASCNANYLCSSWLSTTQRECRLFQ